MAAMSPSTGANDLQSLVPSALQFAGDEPVGRIDSIVLSTGMSGLIAGLLQESSRSTRS